jgi:hypothetical protein
MINKARTPPLNPPVQAPPIVRDTEASSAGENGIGVEAARTRCTGLTGLAQQVCYAAQYGVER